MSTFTTNFSLIKAEGTDAADFTNQNANWDTIDNELFNGMTYLGYDPIPTVNFDLTTYWCEMGSGYSLFTTNGLLIDQPSQYGIVVSFVAGTEIFQIWNSQAGGPSYVRSGNANGWVNSWRKIYDGANKPTTDEIGATPESMIGRSYSVGTYDELIGALDSVLSSTPSHTNKQFEIAFTAAIEPFGGGVFLVSLYKVGDDYATAEMRVYATDSPKIWICSRYDGRWLNWSCLLPTTGGSMTGTIATKGIKLTSGVDYGTTLPSSGTAGQLFFLKA